MLANKKEFLTGYLGDLFHAVQRIDLAVVEQILELMAECRRRDGAIWVIGNGGSALTASHLAVDLGKGASYGKNDRFRVHALVDSIGTITAYGNDVDYADVFVEQLKNVARANDLLISLSGSGNSENVIRAIEYCKDIGVTTIGLTGETGGKLAQMCDHVFQATTDHMGRIEDLHMIVVHLLTYYFMEMDSVE